MALVDNGAEVGQNARFGHRRGGLNGNGWCGRWGGAAVHAGVRGGGGWQGVVGPADAYPVGRGLQRPPGCVVHVGPIMYCGGEYIDQVLTGMTLVARGMAGRGRFSAPQPGRGAAASTVCRVRRRARAQPWGTTSTPRVWRCRPNDVVEVWDGGRWSIQRTDPSGAQGSSPSVCVRVAAGVHAPWGHTNRFGAV